MTLKQEVREVLRHLVFDYTMEEINTETPFDQALTQILTKIKEKLPKKKEILCIRQACMECCFNFGCNIKIRNQALSDTIKMIEEE